MPRCPLESPLRDISLRQLTGAAKGGAAAAKLGMSGSLKKALYAASASAVRANLPTKVASKSAPSSWILFSKDERPKLTGFKGKAPDILKELGKRWSGLDDAAKKSYVDQALKLKDAPGACAAKRPGPQPLVASPSSPVL